MQYIIYMHNEYHFLTCFSPSFMPPKVNALEIRNKGRSKGSPSLMCSSFLSSPVNSKEFFLGKTKETVLRAPHLLPFLMKWVMNFSEIVASSKFSYFASPRSPRILYRIWLLLEYAILEEWNGKDKAANKDKKHLRKHSNKKLKL